MTAELLNIPGHLEAIRKLRKNIVSQQKLLPIDDEIGRARIRGKLDALAEEEHFLQSAQASGDLSKERYAIFMAEGVIRGKEKLIQLAQEKIDRINAVTQRTNARADAIRAEIVQTYRQRAARARSAEQEQLENEMADAYERLFREEHLSEAADMKAAAIRNHTPYTTADRTPRLALPAPATT